MVSLSELNILSSLSSSEVSEEVNVNDAATNCGGRVSSGTTLYAFSIRSIWGSINMLPIQSWVIQNIVISIQRKGRREVPWVSCIAIHNTVGALIDSQSSNV